MRIISQSRDYSAEFGNIELWTQSNIVYSRTCKTDVVLGRYANEERAMEVFMDIHNAYCPVHTISNGFTEDEIKKMFVASENVVSHNITGFPMESVLTTYDDFIYMMPKE